MKSVLLSLKPQWWELMKTGEKTLEIRKSRPRDIDLPARVLVYLPKPEGRIVGEFLVGHFVKTDKIGGLERRSMVPRWKLEKYAKGDILYGWTVDDVVEYDVPQELESIGVEHAPQSWMYVDVSDEWPECI